MSSLKKQGTVAFFWDFFGKLAKQSMGFVITIILARLLEPSDFGTIAMIAVLIGVAQIFADIGLAGALVQRRHLLPVHYSSVFYFNIAVASLLSAVLFFSAPYVGAFYDNDELTPIAQLMSVVFILNSMYSVQNAKLRKELNYKLLSKISFVTAFFSGTIGVTLAFSGFGVWSLVYSTLFHGVIFNIFIWKYSGWTPSLSFSSKALFQLWGYGFRMFLSGLLDAIFTRLDYIIIGKLFSADVLGFFQRAKSLNLFVVNFSSKSLMSVLFPVLSKIQNDLLRFQKVVLKGLGIISFVVFLLLGTLYLNAEELVILLFGEKWLQSVAYFKILALSGFALPVAALLVNILSSRGNSKAFLKLEIYKKIVHSTEYIVLFYFGVIEYLYALFVTSCIALFINIVFAAKEIELKKRQFILPIMSQGLISCIAVATVYFINLDAQLGLLLMLMIKSTEYFILYIFMSWALKTSSYLYFEEQITPIVNKKFGLKLGKS